MIPLCMPVFILTSIIPQTCPTSLSKCSLISTFNFKRLCTYKLFCFFMFEVMQNMKCMRPLSLNLSNLSNLFISLSLSLSLSLSIYIYPSIHPSIMGKGNQQFFSFLTIFSTLLTRGP